MYTYIIQESQNVQNEDPQLLPTSYGPYDYPIQALGAAIEYIRTEYDYEPYFKFQNFGDDNENLKIIVQQKDGSEYLAATVNKMW